MLINSLLSHATDLFWEDLTTTLERLQIRKSVARLMSSHSSHLLEDLTSSILSFQSALVRLTFRKKTTPVNTDDEASHEEMVSSVWRAGGLVEEYDSEGIVKWRKLGFESEDLTLEFEGVGLLGLECLVCPFPFHLSFASLNFGDRNRWYKIIRISSQRPCWSR